MPISEAKKKANKKWNDENMKDRYDRIQIVVPKGQKGIIQAAAAVDHKAVGIGADRQPVHTAVLVFEAVEVGVVHSTCLIG